MPEATCHCGAVRIEVAELPDELNECLCSLCRRWGARWGYHKRASVHVDVGEGATGAYVWNTRTTAFHHCRTCGCVTHWLPTDEERDKVGVNFRMFDPQEIAGVPVHESDGPP